MPQFNKYKTNGRELMVKFTCSRCRAERIERLEPLDEKAGDHYGNLDLLPVPDGWSQFSSLYHAPLCEACTKALAEFFEMAQKEDKG